MITVIHGDDVVSSRNYYLEEKNKAKNPIIFDESNLSLENLVKSLEGGSLFGSENEIFIDTLFSGNNQTHGRNNRLSGKNSKNSIFISGKFRKLKDYQTTLKNSVSKLFKLPQSLFVFWIRLSRMHTKVMLFYTMKLFRALRKKCIFYMIVRQFRLMLALFEKSKTISTK